MKDIDWTAWFYTILLIVVFREGAVAITKVFNHPELGNLVGLMSLLATLLIWRRFRKISNRLIDTNNKIMKESAFAFSPSLDLRQNGKALVIGVAKYVYDYLWLYDHLGQLSDLETTQ